MKLKKYYNKSGYIGDLSQNYTGLNMEWYEFVEKVIKNITGKSIESLPDDDSDEGFYSNLSTSELAEVLDDINNVIDNLTKANKTTIELTTRELNLIKTAMEMWSSPSFSKSREESSIARDIWYNKETARLSSIKDKQHIKYRTNLQYRITRKRNNQVKDYIYCASKYIINYCLDNKISNIVIGYNEGFQQNSDIGKRNNQNFTFIPFGQLKSRIQFLADRLGINVILKEESYTSQASFFDNDEVPTYNPRNPVKYTFSGRRIHRGLYKTAKGTKVNADINGALNILKKCNLTDLSVLQARGKVVIPSRIRL